MNLLEAALAHYEAGRAVLPTRENKAPCCVEGWDRWFTEPQTETEIRDLFSNGAHGLGILLYPACNYIVLDFDGPHAKQAWQATGIPLTDTARSRTKNGGIHLTYKTPSKTADLDTLKRAVRLVKANCDCKKPCGVDLLLRGYSIEPPTPGYTEDADFTIDDAAVIPCEIIELALAKQKKNSDTNSGERFDTASALYGVAEGERDITLFKLACKLRSADVPQDIAENLILDAARNCEPPFLETAALEKVARAYRKYAPKQSTEPQAEKPAATTGSTQRAEIPPAFNFTDQGNSERFARMLGRDVKFSNQTGWYIYDGKRYRRDETQQIKLLARKVGQSMYREAAECPDKDRREALGEWALKCEGEQRQAAIIRMAESEPEIAVREDIFDRDPWLLNCANGTLDLRTGKLGPHKHDDMITKISPVEFDANANIKQFALFLSWAMNGDAELIRFLQKFLGYCLTGSVREQCLCFFTGLGWNGKSTLIKLVEKIMGDYAAPAAKGLLLSKNNEAHPTELADLAGMRLVTSIEADKTRKFDEATLKWLTGGDTLKARQMRQDFFSFEPTHKFIIAANHHPRVTDSTESFWRRIKVIPFINVVTDETKDVELDAKLWTEAPGILAWLVEGCLDWQAKGGLGKAGAIIEATAKYRENENFLAGFIAEHVVEAQGDSVTVKAMFESAKTWLEENGERIVTKRTFNAMMRERGYVDEIMAHNVRAWLNVGLKNNQAEGVS